MAGFGWSWGLADGVQWLVPGGVVVDLVWLCGFLRSFARLVVTVVAVV